MSTDYDADDQVPAEKLDPARLREETDRMIDALTDPRYIEAVRAVRAAPDDRRLAEATRRLSPDGLRELGVPIPGGMRLSSRYFEPGLTGEVELGDPEDGRPSVTSLNEVAPGLLDRLRADQPELFAALAIAGPPPAVSNPNALLHCSCGGHAVPFTPTVVCGGAGIELPF